MDSINKGFAIFDDEIEANSPNSTAGNPENAVSSPKPPEFSSEQAPSANESMDSQKNESPSTGNHIIDMKQRYLIFSLSGKKYATPLLSAREVIEVPKCRSIPNTIDHFVGFANLRGEVIGIVDLRKMFNFDTKAHERNSVIIYESKSGPLGALIDEIIGVVDLDQSVIARDVNIKSNVSQKYLEGIAKLPSEELVIVLDLHNILEDDEVVSIQENRQLA